MASPQVSPRVSIGPTVTWSLAFLNVPAFLPEPRAAVIFVVWSQVPGLVRCLSRTGRTTACSPFMRPHPAPAICTTSLP